MTLLAGLVLGALGALAHLGCAFWRARLFTSGRTALAFALYPVALAGPVLAVLAAVALAPEAAWAALAGIVVVRFVFLRKRVEVAS